MAYRQCHTQLNLHVHGTSKQILIQPKHKSNMAQSYSWNTCIYYLAMNNQGNISSLRADVQTVRSHCHKCMGQPKYLLLPLKHTHEG